MMTPDEMRAAVKDRSRRLRHTAEQERLIRYTKREGAPVVLHVGRRRRFRDRLRELRRLTRTGPAHPKTG